MSKLIILSLVCFYVGNALSSELPPRHPGRPMPCVHVKLSDVPKLPIEVKVQASPEALVAGLGFAGCVAAIQMYKEGSKLAANKDVDVVIQKAKQDEGNELIQKSYILFSAGLLAIFNKYILSTFTKQG